MVLLASVLAYTFLKTKYMVDKEEWNLIQQTVMATKNDLQTPKMLNETRYANISIGIQFYEKREKLTLAAMQASKDAAAMELLNKLDDIGKIDTSAVQG